MKKIVFLVLILVIILSGFFLYYREGSLPVNKNDKSTKIFVVKPGETVADITKNLENEGLIRNKVVFLLDCKTIRD